MSGPRSSACWFPPSMNPQIDVCLAGALEIHGYSLSFGVAQISTVVTIVAMDHLCDEMNHYRRLISFPNGFLVSNFLGSKNAVGWRSLETVPEGNAYVHIAHMLGAIAGTPDAGMIRFCGARLRKRLSKDPWRLVTFGWSCLATSRELRCLSRCFILNSAVATSRH